MPTPRRCARSYPRSRSTGRPTWAASTPAATAGSAPGPCAWARPRRSSGRCRRPWCAPPPAAATSSCASTSTRPISTCPGTWRRWSRCWSSPSPGGPSPTTNSPTPTEPSPPTSSVADTDAEARRRARLIAGAERVLRANWREGHRAEDGVEYAFTCPATPRYRHQWYWDSCFHAIVWRHFDPARARRELHTLVRAGRLDGFIPHTAFWDRPAYWRRAPFYGTHTVFGASATATMQTPLLAVAWERVAAASPDVPGFAAEGLPQLRLHYEWLARERDVDGDGLLTTIYPDESGLDDSPKHDAVFGRMRHDSVGYWWLVERYRRLGYDARAITERYDEHLEDVLVNVFYALGLQALSRLDGENRELWSGRASLTEAALLERCYDERTGLFFDLAGRGEMPVGVSTWSALAP